MTSLEQYTFPPLSARNSIGLLAIGGDLSPGRLLRAYTQGIFPWYQEKEPILWWCPQERFVLFPGNIKISKSTQRTLKKQIFRITYDTAFEQVITACRALRLRTGTWIHKEIIEAYTVLHHWGYAHSVEVWQDGQLSGGLYGIALGRCFFGESMFSRKSNASKVALIGLCENLTRHSFTMIDCQIYSEHLAQLGARIISSAKFLKLLQGGLEGNKISGKWNKHFT